MVAKLRKKINIRLFSFLNYGTFMFYLNEKVPNRYGFLKISYIYWVGMNLSVSKENTYFQ